MTIATDLPPFPAGIPRLGLLLHVTSLPSPYGIGMWAAALAWVDHLHEAGQSWWQAPAGPHGMAAAVPTLSSFAGNDLLISPDWLIEETTTGERLPATVSGTAVGTRQWFRLHRLLETA
jgi:4-alpha-glucanotransferase